MTSRSNWRKDLDSGPPSLPHDELRSKRRQIHFSPDEAKAQKDEEAEPAPSQFMSSKHHKGPIHRTFMFITAPVRSVTKAASRKPKALIMKEEKDRFDAMRGIQTGAAKFKKWYALLLSVIAFGVLWCVRCYCLLAS